MRMAVYKLVAEEVYHIHYIKVLLLLTYLCVEKDMKEHISKFLGQFPFLSLEDSVTEFIYFLYGLLAVPWTFFPEFIKDFYNAGKSLLFFL